MRFTSALRTIPQYQGRTDDEILGNIQDVFSSGDTSRINPFISALSQSIPQYQGRQPQEIFGNIQSVFSDVSQPPPLPETPPMPTGEPTLSNQVQGPMPEDPNLQPPFTPPNPAASLPAQPVPVSGPMPNAPNIQPPFVSPEPLPAPFMQPEKPLTLWGATKQKYDSFDVGLTRIASSQARAADLAIRGSRMPQTYNANDKFELGDTDIKPMMTPKKWDELTKEEKKAQTNPTFLKHVATFLDNSILAETQQDVAENSKLSLSLKGGNAVGNLVMQQLPIYMQQFGLGLVPGVGIPLGVGASITMETGGFLQEAEMLAEKYGVTGDNLAEWQHIADKKAPLYGALSGAVEYIGNAFGFLGALKKGGGKETSAQVLKKILANPTAKAILMKFAKKSLRIFGEGAEEWTQGGLMNAFMTPAVIEMRKIDPYFAMGWEPSTGSELLEQGVQGAVVAGALKVVPGAAGAARRSKLRSKYKNLVKQSEQIKQNQARETELKNAETQADLEAEPETPF